MTSAGAGHMAHRRGWGLWPVDRAGSCWVPATLEASRFSELLVSLLYRRLPSTRLLGDLCTSGKTGTTRETEYLQVLLVPTAAVQ